MRRTIIRYVNLSAILVLRLVASRIHDRFPTYESLVKANLLLPHEKERMETIEERTPYETTYLPFVWALNLLQNAQKQGKIEIKAPIFTDLLKSFDKIKEQNRNLFNHGWINFPLAYTQVITALKSKY